MSGLVCVSSGDVCGLVCASSGDVFALDCASSGDVPGLICVGSGDVSGLIRSALSSCDVSGLVWWRVRSGLSDGGVFGWSAFVVVMCLVQSA